MAKHREVVEKPLYKFTSEGLTHGVTEPPDQSSQNSGNKPRLARIPNVATFVDLWQIVCQVSAVNNFWAPPEKVGQSSP